MKKHMYQIFCLILFLGFIHAQDDVSNTIKIKGIEEIAREQNPDLFYRKMNLKPRQNMARGCKNKRLLSKRFAQSYWRK